MAGLFTLNDESLGVLDANALGGAGTGFVVGSVTSAGSATGSVGYLGSASGSQVSAGSATGAEGNTGTIGGVSTSAGSVTGVKGSVGVVNGTTVPVGTAAGSPGLNGSVMGFSASTAEVVGSPTLAGSVTGSGVSSGSVTGSQPQPPEPPAPEPETSGGVSRYWYYPAPKTIREGRTRSRASRTRGGVSGTAGRSGTVITVQVTDGLIRGLAEIVLPILFPPRDSIAERQAFEDELLTVWVD